MKLDTILHEDLVFVQKDFSNAKEVITFLSKKLLEKGYVKEDFLPAILEREEKFPTGLYLGKINVAIPHTDIKYVNKSGMAVATLKKPISFGKMDDPTIGIPVHIVFLLALVDPNKCLKFLSSLTRSFNDESFISLIYSLNDTERFVELTKKV